MSKIGSDRFRLGCACAPDPRRRRVIGGGVSHLLGSGMAQTARNWLAYLVKGRAT